MNTEPTPPPCDPSLPATNQVAPAPHQASAPPALPPRPALPSATPPHNRWVSEPFEGPVNFGSVIENLLKHPGRILHSFSSGSNAVARMALLGSVLGLAIFGMLLGSYSGSIQFWAAPLKVTTGTFLAVLICLPSLYIFSALGGIDATLAYVMKVLVATISLTSRLLLGFAPVLWVFSQSTESVPFVGFLAIAFWLVALLFGLRLLLAASSMQGAQCIDYIKVWMIIFVVVTLQMSTALRPIIGTADTFLPTEKRFFLQHWFEEVGGARK